jgi:hypothetical protein
VALAGRAGAWHRWRVEAQAGGYVHGSCPGRVGLRFKLKAGRCVALAGRAGAWHRWRVEAH